MGKSILIRSLISLQCRRLLPAGDVLLLPPLLTLAGAQRKETLSDDITSVMRSSISNANPPRLVLASAQEGGRWLSAMLSRLVGYVPNEGERHRLLVNVQYEASRAGLDPRVVLGPIEMESVSRQYTISGVDARGLVQVMPFWRNYISKPSRNLFDIRTNLRYGCTILRHYNDLESGSLYRVLARFNGSLGSNKYLNAVLGTWRDRWQWG